VTVLIDATLVRLVLLLGERNWWLPGWLARWLPPASPLARRG
jgi:RND superfamily putative drug exporter